MFIPRFLLIVAVTCLAYGQNSTDDLEVRVTILEEDVSDLESDVVELRTDNTLQDERLNIMEETVIENVNDISDLDSSVDATEDTMILLQQRMAALEEMNNLLLERVGILETTDETSIQRITDLESTTSELEGAVNATSEIVEDHEIDIEDANTRLVTVEEDVAEQDDRMTTVENLVDDWDDRIVSLEVANNDVQERLIVLEETITVPWVACASSPCSNGATCIDVNVDTFVCMCRDGYYGETCQYTPTEACSSSSCENGGTCHDINVETFICSCRDGYFGSSCGESYRDTSFLASVSPTPGTPDDPIVFNVARINPGGHYDVTTGIYTVPVNGTYEFMVHIWSVTDDYYIVYLEVDDVQITYGRAQDLYEGTGEDPYMDFSVMLSLTVGQQVWLSGSDLTGMQGDSGNVMYSWFSGHLIHAF